MAESEQIWWAYVKIENVAEIYSARIYSSKDELIFSVTKYVLTIFLTISSKQSITYHVLWTKIASSGATLD